MHPCARLQCEPPACRTCRFRRSGFASDGVHGGESALVTTATETTPPISRRASVDAVLAEAVELARDAAVALAGAANVGEHLGVHADGERLVTHDFACLDQAYRGWRWAVTLTRASRSKTVTVDEAVLLPGPDSLLAPEWVPWSERLKPGDLGVGDLLITEEDDDRLEPGYAGSVALDERVDEVADEIDRVAIWELGLGRARSSRRSAATMPPTGGTPVTAARPPRSRWPPLRPARRAASSCRSPGRCAACSACARTSSPRRRHGRLRRPRVRRPLRGRRAARPDRGDPAGPRRDRLRRHRAAPGRAPPGSVDDEAPPEDLGHS